MIEPDMTLRDYFAAKAMQSIIMKSSSRDGPTPAEDIERITRVSAVGAYAYADAMLEERSHEMAVSEPT
jgi:hypothetical protein